MKIQPQTLNQLAERITPLDTTELRNDYRAGNFPRSESVKDLDMRYRWDLYWVAKGGEVTKGMDLTSNHIDTGLRSIVPTLTTRHEIAECANCDDSLYGYMFGTVYCDRCADSI